MVYETVHVLEGKRPLRKLSIEVDKRSAKDVVASDVTAAVVAKYGETGYATWDRFWGWSWIPDTAHDAGA